MKVVIPLNEPAGPASSMCEHFGSAPYYAVADTETATIEISANGNSHHDHGQCTPADVFVDMGVNAVICNGIGARAASKLQMMGIDVYMAGLAPTLEEALKRFGEGLLTKVTAQQACQGHDCH
ncbi:MAG: NifB/NifX family molybdenum-iron cluster-binding protein [Chlorobium sp.]|nr:NifB/NifX family molybdenum-iron cluster-binding protein [Chlorobium sp.]